MNNLNISTDELLQLAEKVENETLQEREAFRTIEEHNQIKVLNSFISHRVSDLHFAGSTGYGYNDTGRETLDEIYAEVFGGESALVRWQFVSGTHAISSALFGILRSGDEFLSITGSPYDTLAKVIGLKGKTRGTIMDYGINYREVPLLNENADIDSLGKYINSKTRLAFIQRSRGYVWRESLCIEEIEKIIKKLREIKEDIIVLVDNCYGEFVDKKEPCNVGADLVAGSLIKNPGGGICPTGGYVVGREELIEQVASYLTAPGIGREVGATLNINRTLYQGLYLAPMVVSQSVQGMIWAGRLFEKLGFRTSPVKGQVRGDIVQAVELDSKENLLSFCQGIQSSSPVESYLSLEGASMPGYEDKVVMAAGTFVQGGSLELSSDGPLRPPFIVYLQGGLSYFHIKYSVMNAVKKLLKHQC